MDTSGNSNPSEHAITVRDVREFADAARRLHSRALWILCLSGALFLAGGVLFGIAMFGQAENKSGDNDQLDRVDEGVKEMVTFLREANSKSESAKRHALFTVAYSDIRQFSTNIMVFQTRTGRLPLNLSEIRPSKGGGASVNDPWGRPYIYEISGDGEEYVLRSRGEDEKDESDDIWHDSAENETKRGESVPK